MYRFVYVTYMLMVASSGVIFVFLEDFESQFGVPAWGIGLIAAIGFLTAVIASVGISPLGDRGYLKSMGAVGFVATIVGNVAFGLSDELWSLALSRALVGIGTGLFSIVGRKALIGEVTDDSGEKVGMFISAAVAGFIAGPVVGSALSNFGGISTPFLVLAAVLAVVSVPTMIWLSTVPVAVSETASSGSMVGLLKEPGVRAAVATQVAVFFNIGVFDATVDEYLTDQGLDTNGVGIVILLVGLPLLFVPKLMGRHVDNIPRPADVMLRAFVLFVPIVLTLGLWEGVVVFTTFAVMQTFVESTLFPAATRVVINETGAEHSASGTGLLDASGSLAAAFSSLLAPIAYDWTDGPLGSFGVSGVFAAAMLIVAWANVGQRDRRKGRSTSTPLTQ